MSNRPDDPCDAINTLEELQAWASKACVYPGVLVCMWTNSIPAIALAHEPWRGSNKWLESSEENRRIVDYNWRTSHGSEAHSRGR